MTIARPMDKPAARYRFQCIPLSIAFCANIEFFLRGVLREAISKDVAHLSATTFV